MSYGRYMVGLKQPSTFRMTYSTDDLQDAFNTMLENIAYTNGSEEDEVDSHFFRDGDGGGVILYYASIYYDIHVLIDSMADDMDSRTSKPATITNHPLVDWFGFLKYVAQKYSNVELQDFVTRTLATYHIRYSIENGRVFKASALLNDVERVSDLAFSSTTITDTFFAIMRNYAINSTYPQQQLTLDEILVLIEWQDGE